MRFFNSEIWKALNSSDCVERARAESVWAENDKKYMEYIQSVERNLPQPMYDQLIKCEGFHDWEICALRIDEKKNGNRILLDIASETLKCTIVFENPLNETLLQAKLYNNLVLLNDMCIGYCEFCFYQDYISFSILTDTFDEMVFLCTSIHIAWENKGRLAI